MPGRRPARGLGGCAGRGRDSGPGGLCRGRPAGAGGGVPGRFGGWFFPGGGAKNFFQKGPTRMYKEAVDPVSARLVDKAIFGPILWWV